MTDDLVKRMMHLARPSSWLEAKAPTKNDLFVAQVYLAEGASRIEALTAERDQAWKMVAEADTRLGQALGDALQDKADNARLREVVLEADKLLCGDLTGLQWKRECRSFLVLARAVLKGETRD